MLTTMRNVSSLISIFSSVFPVHEWRKRCLIHIVPSSTVQSEKNSVLIKRHFEQIIWEVTEFPLRTPNLLVLTWGDPFVRVTMNYMSLGPSTHHLSSIITRTHSTTITWVREFSRSSSRSVRDDPNFLRSKCPPWTCLESLKKLPHWGTKCPFVPRHHALHFPSAFVSHHHPLPAHHPYRWPRSQVSPH